MLRKKRYKLTTRLVLLWILTVTMAEVEVLHYGQYGGLNIVCNRDELILVESEQLGYSTTKSCNPSPMCSVPYTLAKWYCRGKSACTGMQVERRPLHKRTCGSDFTNCLRVEYQCIKKSRLVDVCSDEEHQAWSGYLSSPSFPDMYPPHQNCSCVLSAHRGRRVQISTAFFLLKSSSPCHDWLQVSIDGGSTTRRCGYIPQQQPYLGETINFNFRSDAFNQGMGFWLKYEGTQNTPITLKCGRFATTTTTITTTPTTTPAPTTKRTTTTTTTPTPKKVTTVTQRKPTRPWRRWMSQTTVVPLVRLTAETTRSKHNKAAKELAMDSIEHEEFLSRGSSELSLGDVKGKESAIHISAENEEEFMLGVLDIMNTEVDGINQKELDLNYDSLLGGFKGKSSEDDVENETESFGEWDLENGKILDVTETDDNQDESLVLWETDLKDEDGQNLALWETITEGNTEDSIIQGREKKGDRKNTLEYILQEISQNEESTSQNVEKSEELGTEASAEIASDSFEDRQSPATTDDMMSVSKVLQDSTMADTNEEPLFEIDINIETGKEDVEEEEEEYDIATSDQTEDTEEMTNIPLVSDVKQGQEEKPSVEDNEIPPMIFDPWNILGNQNDNEDIESEQAMVTEEKDIEGGTFGNLEQQNEDENDMQENRSTDDVITLWPTPKSSEIWKTNIQDKEEIQTRNDQSKSGDDQSNVLEENGLMSNANESMVQGLLSNQGTLETDNLINPVGLEHSEPILSQQDLFEPLEVLDFDNIMNLLPQQTSKIEDVPIEPLEAAVTQALVDHNSNNIPTPSSIDSNNKSPLSDGLTPESPRSIELTEVNLREPEIETSTIAPSTTQAMPIWPQRSLIHHVFGQEIMPTDRSGQGAFQGYNKYSSFHPYQSHLIQEDDALIIEPFHKSWDVNWDELESKKSGSTHLKDSSLVNLIHNDFSEEEIVDPIPPSLFTTAKPAYKWPSFTEPFFSPESRMPTSDHYITDSVAHRRNYRNREYHGGQLANDTEVADPLKVEIDLQESNKNDESIFQPKENIGPKETVDVSEIKNEADPIQIWAGHERDLQSMIGLVGKDEEQRDDTHGDVEYVIPNEENLQSRIVDPWNILRKNKDQAGERLEISIDGPNIPDKEEPPNPLQGFQETDQERTDNEQPLPLWPSSKPSDVWDSNIGGNIDHSYEEPSHEEAILHGEGEQKPIIDRGPILDLDFHEANLIEISPEFEYDLTEKEIDNMIELVQDIKEEEIPAYPTEQEQLWPVDPKSKSNQHWPIFGEEANVNVEPDQVPNENSHGGRNNDLLDNGEHPFEGIGNEPSILNEIPESMMEHHEVGSPNTGNHFDKLPNSIQQRNDIFRVNNKQQNSPAEEMKPNEFQTPKFEQVDMDTRNVYNFVPLNNEQPNNLGTHELERKPNEGFRQIPNLEANSIPVKYESIPREANTVPLMPQGALNANDIQRDIWNKNQNFNPSPRQVNPRFSHEDDDHTKYLPPGSLTERTPIFPHRNEVNTEKSLIRKPDKPRMFPDNMISTIPRDPSMRDQESNKPTPMLPFKPLINAVKPHNQFLQPENEGNIILLESKNQEDGVPVVDLRFPSVTPRATSPMAFGDLRTGNKGVKLMEDSNVRIPSTMPWTTDQRPGETTKPGQGNGFTQKPGILAPNGRKTANTDKNKLRNPKRYQTHPKHNHNDIPKKLPHPALMPGNRPVPGIHPVPGVHPVPGARPGPGVHPVPSARPGPPQLRPLPDKRPEDMDPDLYVKLKNYMSNLEVEQVRDTDETEDPLGPLAVESNEGSDDSAASGHTVWLLMIVGIIGWLVFVAVLGILIYYKRDRMCRTRRARRLARVRNHGNRSAIPSHILFPPLALPASPKSSAYKPSTISNAKSLDTLSSKSSQSNDDPRLPVLGKGAKRRCDTVADVTVESRPQDSGDDRPLPPVPGNRGNNRAAEGRGARQNEGHQNQRGLQHINLHEQNLQHQNLQHQNLQHQNVLQNQQNFNQKNRQDQSRTPQNLHHQSNQPEEIQPIRQEKIPKQQNPQRYHAVAPEPAQRAPEPADPDHIPVTSYESLGKYAANNLRQDTAPKSKPSGTATALPKVLVESGNSSEDSLRAQKRESREREEARRQREAELRTKDFWDDHRDSRSRATTDRSNQSPTSDDTNCRNSSTELPPLPAKTSFMYKNSALPISRSHHPASYNIHPQGMKIPHNFPQATTPFLSPKRGHLQREYRSNSGPPPPTSPALLSVWRSNSTLNTEHSGDTDAIYQCLKKIADSYSTCNIATPINITPPMPLLPGHPHYDSSHGDGCHDSNSDSLDDVPPPVPPPPLHGQSGIGKEPRKPPRQRVLEPSHADLSASRDVLNNLSPRIGDKANSADRIRKVIPTEASEFNDRLQPELSYIVNGRQTPGATARGNGRNHGNRGKPRDPRQAVQV